MAIKNPDGSVYNPAGSLQQFDPNNPEYDLFNLWDQEAIGIGGSPIYYYEVFIDSNMIDPINFEARGKIFSNTPVCLYGYYNPVPSQNMMSVFGIDSPDEVMFEFNYRDTLKRIGHPPKIGSRFFTPHKRENWKIIQCNVEEFRLWGNLRLQVMCERFQESLTTGEGRVTQKQPDYQVDAVHFGKDVK
jgi:hypothetical protein